MSPRQLGDWRETHGNKNSPFRETNGLLLSCFQAPLFGEVTFDGKIRSDGTQPSKPVCDWSVGPWGGEVKDEFPATMGCLQLDHGYTSYAGSPFSTSCG